MTLTAQITQLAKQAKAASRDLARLTTAQKDSCLLAMADALQQNGPAIKQANALDMDAGAAMGLSSAMLDRLKLDDKRIAGIANGLREVAALRDPVGRVLDERVRPNGLKLQKISTPIGVVVIIYESRPNVTADAASLCFKSSNASNLCMPRGGEGLIRAVAECSKVPVIKHYKGVCHVYVDADADPNMAEEIVMNAKVQRPAVCNAMETLLIDKAIAPVFLPSIAQKLAASNVELRADEGARAILDSKLKTNKLKLKPASEQDWFTEYNDYILNVRVVDGDKQAIHHINHYGSAHSDSIVTRNEARAKQFLREVDSAAVYWNASTRFTDGAEFGMGAEIGISTDKIGARGPMGLEELTSYKWLGIGTGQLRT